MASSIHTVHPRTMHDAHNAHTYTPRVRESHCGVRLRDTLSHLYTHIYTATRILTHCARRAAGENSMLAREIDKNLNTRAKEREREREREREATLATPPAPLSLSLFPPPPSTTALAGHAGRQAQGASSRQSRLGQRPRVPLDVYIYMCTCVCTCVAERVAASPTRRTHRRVGCTTLVRSIYIHARKSLSEK